MGYLVGIIVLVIFFAIAPKFLRTLMKWMIAIWIGGFIILRILALIFGAGRSGRNAGMFEDQAFMLIGLGIAIPCVVVVGIILGLIIKRLPKSTAKNQD